MHLHQEGITFEEGAVLQSQVLYAKLPRNQYPVGFIWYSQDLVDLTNIGYIFVHEHFRRQGLATAMLRELQRWYPKNSVSTAVGNELSTPWLAAAGFIHERDGWFLRTQYYDFMFGTGAGI